MYVQVQVERIATQIQIESSRPPQDAASAAVHWRLAAAANVASGNKTAAW